MSAGVRLTRPLWVTWAGINHWYRLRKMNETRLNFEVFKWATRRANARCGNWCVRIQNQFRKCDITTLFQDIDIHEINIDHVKDNIK